MATYYVNTSTGSNSYNGLFDTFISGVIGPWKTPLYAANMLVAGDILNIAGTSPTNPERFGYASKSAGSGVGSEINIYGELPYSYFTLSRDVSHGATIDDYFTNNDMSGWLSSSVLWGWTTDSGNVARESTIVNAGKVYSAKLYNSWAGIYHDMVLLPGSTEFTLSWDHYETNDTYRFIFKIWDATANKYLQADKTSWDVGAVWIDIGVGGCSLNAWGTSSFDFTSNTTTGRYKVNVITDHGSGTYYLNKISIVPKTLTTYEWTLVGGQNYYLLNLPIAKATCLCKWSSADWIVNGISSPNAAYVPLAADLATCGTTPGSYYYNSTTGALYYTPAIGETVSDLHFELGNVQPFATHDLTPANCSIYVDHEYNKIYNIRASLGAYNYYCNKANNTIESLYGYHGIDSNFLWANNGTATKCISNYTHTEDGFVTSGTAVATLNKCYATKSHDDGFQAVGGKIIANNCKSFGNGLEAATDNSGFCGEGGDIELYRCVAYDNTGPGIYIGAGQHGTVKNCISYNNNVDVRNLGTIDEADYNCYVTELTWTPGAHDVNLDPLFIDAANGDFRLLPTSPCRDAGVVIAGLTTDFEGKPVPMGSAPDIGAYEIPVSDPIGLNLGLSGGGRMIPPRRRRR